MKKSLLMLTILSSIVLFGCQKTGEVKGENQSPKPNEVNNISEVIEGDFIYRLITEKDHYNKGEDVKIYAELEYIGGKQEVEISHGGSPFLFPMTETTRNYDIEYAVTMVGKRTVLKKGKPMREELNGGGGYSDHDKEKYKDFMKKVMKANYPSGHYIVNGFANFHVEDDLEKEYTIEAQIEFYVDSDE